MNQDKLRLFPNQLIDGDPTECAALTVTDLIANLLGFPFDPDFTYAFTLRIMGQQPNTNGLDPHAAMASAVVYGTLPITQETFTAKVLGELYVANYQNYSAVERENATLYPEKGIIELSNWTAIVNYLNRNTGGVSLPMVWHASFATPNADGTLPAPSGATSNHNVAVYGYDPAKGLLIKPWLGASYGQGGYAYLTPAVFGQVALTAYAFDPNAWRWLSLALIGFQYTAAIPDILPVMSSQSSQTGSGATPNAPATEAPFTPKIIAWSQIIAKEEGANPESNNPGNLKYSTLTASWGASKGKPAADGGFLCQFETPEAGQNALCSFLKLGCENELLAFHAPESRTLAGFTKIYAGNPPQGYIDAIVQAMGGDPNVQISTFLS